MICPTCRTPNPDSARYCLRCGASLVSICPTCQAELPGGAHFCSNCGSPVPSDTTAADQERLARLAASIPEQLGEKVRSAARLVEERRIITILVAEVLPNSGEDADPEDLSEAISRQFDRLAPDIYRYEGTIARLVGNTLLAFFGAPLAHEDDPLRAVRAALDLLETTRQVAADNRADVDICLSIRVGLATGAVIIGNLGSNLTYEYTALGGAINLAENVMNLAQPGTLTATANIYRYISPYYDCTEVGSVPYERRGDTLRVYQINAPKPQPGQSRGLPGLTSRMVGRKQELEDLLQLTSMVQAGMGRGVLILGEPGLGKSRLIAEWKAAVEKSCSQQGDETCPIWVEGHSVSYGHGLPYHLLANLLRSLAGIPIAATEPEARLALFNFTTQLLGEDYHEVYLFLANLLSLQLDASERERITMLDPQALQSQYLIALRRLLAAQATIRPVILILEDLHWADPSSTELLNRLLAVITQSPILICVVSRPDQDSPGWRLVAALRQTLAGTLKEINLNPLNEQDSQELVSNLLEIAALPPHVRSLILQKSEGNPFFVEEVIRMLIDRGAIRKKDETWVASAEVGTLKIPDNLQGLLLARIDRLPNDVKRTLRIAAVIGRQFSVRLLSEVVKTEGMEWIPGHMVTLEANNHIRLAQVGPEVEYSFRHTLTREAAYTSLLKNDRRHLHMVVGEAIERLYPDRLHDFASLLGSHFLEASDDQRALKYFTIAADKALNRYASQEAENHYHTALKLTGNIQARAHLLTGLGRALELQGKYEESIQAWLLAIELYRQLEDIDYVAVLYANISRTAWHAGDTPGGLKYALEGLTIVSEDHESPGLAALLHEAGRAYYFNGNPEQALDYCQRAYDLARRLDVIDVQAEAQITMGILASQSTEQKLEALFSAVKLAESAGLLRTAARAHHNIGSFSPNNREAIQHFKRAAEINRQIGSIVEEFNELVSLTGIQIGEGNLAEVEKNLREMEALIEQMADTTLPRVYMNILQANLLLFKGQWDEALQITRTCLASVRQRGDLQNTANLDNTLAQILIEMAQWEGLSDWQEAESALQEAMQIADRGVAVTTGHLTLLAAIRILQGRLDEADTLLQNSQKMLGSTIYALELGLLSWIKAGLASARKQWTDALLEYERAAGIMSDLNLRWNWARVLHDWAEALVARRQPSDLEEARTLTLQSLEIFRQIGSQRYADLVQERLKTINTAIYAEMLARERTSADLALAGRIQTSLMPENTPAIPGYGLAARLESAQETSGDFYDFIELPGGKTALIIADVTDKGPGAAMFMAMSRTLLRTFATQHIASPEKAIHAVNQRMHEDAPGGLFVSLFYSILDPHEHTLTYVNAGHNPPFLLRAQDPSHLHTIGRTGTQLGLFDDAVWTHDTLILEPGDVLLLYTDGVLDTQNLAEQFFGNDRLENALKTAAGKSATEILDSILKEVHTFMGAAPMADDITIMVVKREA